MNLESIAVLEIHFQSIDQSGKKASVLLDGKTLANRVVLFKKIRLEIVGCERKILSEKEKIPFFFCIALFKHA